MFIEKINKKKKILAKIIPNTKYLLKEMTDTDSRMQEIIIRNNAVLSPLIITVKMEIIVIKKIKNLLTLFLFLWASKKMTANTNG